MAERHDREATGWGRGFAMVGRARESALLLAVLARPPAVVLVEGEAGIGKSRLVHEAGQALADRGVRVLTGSCSQLREPLPFGPVLEALRPIRDWLPGPEGLSAQAGALAPLLPGLADRLPVPPGVPSDAHGVRFQLVGAVRAVLEALGPAVLVVEDLHWVDEATRDLLLLLARDLPNRLGLVLTYRREDLPAGAAVLGTPYRRPVGTGGAEIRLDPLTRADVDVLAASALGGRATPELGRALFRRSGGLPLVVEEDLLTLTDPTRETESTLTALESGSPISDVALLEGSEVPRGLREAAVARMAGLAAETSALVRAAAVLAVPATRPVLAAVAGLDADQATGALLEALAAAVLTENAPALYGFRHALAQQALYRAIPGPLREDLHRKVLETLRHQNPAPLVQIAHHTRALGDVQAWLRDAEAAADQAIALGDDGTAAILLRDILDQPRLDTGLRTRAALALARIAEVSVGYAATLTALRRIVADPQLPVPVRGEIRLALGVTMYSRAADRAGYQEFERAVQELETRPDLASRAMCALALSPGQSPGQTDYWLDRAEQAVHGSPNEAARLDVLGNRLALLGLRGDPRVWELAGQLPRNSDDPETMRHIVRIWHNLGVVAGRTGHDKRAAQLFTEQADLARQFGNGVVESLSRVNLLYLDWLAGRWAGLDERAVAFAAEHPDVNAVAAMSAHVRGCLAAAQGQWTRALKLLDQAAALRAGLGPDSSGLALTNPVAIARVHLARRGFTAAWGVLEPALEALRHGAAWTCAGDSLSVGVQAALAVGRDPAAKDLVAQADRGLGGKDAPAACADLDHARGILLLHDGEAESAADRFDSARRRFQAVDRPYSVARAIEGTAAAYRCFRPGAAAEELTRAAEAYAGLGAAADAARCHKDLRELGLGRRSGPGRRGYGSELSPREDQVARLLADGATNQDIAHALALSPRTVEHHVTNVLKKLGTTREGLRNAGPAGMPG